MQPLSVLMLAATVEDDRRRQRDRRRVWEPHARPARITPMPPRGASVDRPRLKDLPAQG
jgi:hypothetical protein